MRAMVDSVMARELRQAFGGLVTTPELQPVTGVLYTPVSGGPAVDIVTGAVTRDEFIFDGAMTFGPIDLKSIADGAAQAGDMVALVRVEDLTRRPSTGSRLVIDSDEYDVISSETDMLASHHRLVCRAHTGA